MSTGAPEKVFPKPSAGPASPGAGGKLSLRGVDRKTWMWAGAGVVALVAVTVGRSQEADDPEDELSTYDTSTTDLYNELQPDLEQIGDTLEELSTKWETPEPAEANEAPSQPVKSPVKGPKNPAVRNTYKVQPGDTLSSVAKKKKVKGGAARLYAVNRKIIKRAAEQHKVKNPGTTRKLFAGTVLVIP